MTIYVIKFDNGSYNQGGGHEVRLQDATRYDTFEGAEVVAQQLMGVFKIMNVAVHESHCCEHHGCKYGDEDCTVTSGETRQLYPCEECREEGPKEKAIRELIKCAQDLVDLREMIDVNEYIVRKIEPLLSIIKHGNKHSD